MGQVPPSPEIIKIIPNKANPQPESPPIGSPTIIKPIPTNNRISRSKLQMLPVICLPLNFHIGIIAKFPGN